jgi:hypothetical protein
LVAGAEAAIAVDGGGGGGSLAGGGVGSGAGAASAGAAGTCVSFEAATTGDASPDPIPRDASSAVGSDAGSAVAGVVSVVAESVVVVAVVAVAAASVAAGAAGAGVAAGVVVVVVSGIAPIVSLTTGAFANGSALAFVFAGCFGWRSYVSVMTGTRLPIVDNGRCAAYAGSIQCARRPCVARREGDCVAVAAGACA